MTAIQMLQGAIGAALMFAMIWGAALGCVAMGGSPAVCGI